MNKILTLLIMTLLVLSSIPFAFAEGNNQTTGNDDSCVADADCDSDEVCTAGACEDIGEDTNDNETSDEDIDNETNDDDTEDVIDDDTQKELEIIGTIPGNEYRKLQLEKAIDLALTSGTAVVQYIGEDTEALDDLLVKLDALLTEAQNLDTSSDDFASEYVRIKQESKEVVKEFKGAARELLTVDDKKELQDILKDIRSDIHDEYKDLIGEKRQEMNRNRLKKFLDETNLDAELAEQVMNGDVTPKEAVAKMKQKFGGLSEEQKQQIREKTREHIAREKVIRARVRQNVQEHKEEIRNRVRERIEQKVKATVREEVKNRIEQKIRTQIKDRLKDRAEDRAKEKAQKRLLGIMKEHNQ